MRTLEQSNFRRFSHSFSALQKLKKYALSLRRPFYSFYPVKYSKLQRQLWTRPLSTRVATASHFVRTCVRFIIINSCEKTFFCCQVAILDMCLEVVPSNMLKLFACKQSVSPLFSAFSAS